MTAPELSALVPVADPVVWTGLALVTACDALGVWWLGWSVVWRPVVSLSVGVLALLAVAVVYRRRGPGVARFAAAMAYTLASGPLGSFATYLVTRAGFPLRDAELAAMDRALGFRWDVFSEWVWSHPALASLLGFTYVALPLESVLVVVVLAWLRPSDLRAFLRAASLASLVAILVSVVLPAAGALPDALPSATVLALRSGALTTLDATHLVGIVSMPSFHAALTVIMAFAAWPIRWLRWPVALFSVVMLVATVPMGTHYLVDVLAALPLAVWCARVCGMPAVRRA